MGIIPIKDWSIDKTAGNVTRVKIPFSKVGDTCKVLLRSDAHHDNPHCRRDMETRHLKKALKDGAGIIDAGDLFCAMQGKYDRRSDKSELAPEYQCTDYLDALKREAADYYEPYAKNFIGLGMGNHETAILKNHETNLTNDLCSRLSDRCGQTVHPLGYTFWVWFQFINGGSHFPITMWGTHGYGGGGPVTEDMIQSNRQRVFIENADIMMSGHVHRSWVQEFVKLRLNNRGIPERRTGYYVKTPTYKDAYGDGSGRFEEERGHGPRPLGAYWLEFVYNREQIDGKNVRWISTRVYKAD